MVCPARGRRWKGHRSPLIDTAVMTAQLLYWPVRGGVARMVVGRALGEWPLYLYASAPGRERHGDALLDSRTAPASPTVKILSEIHFL